MSKCDECPSVCESPVLKSKQRSLSPTASTTASDSNSAQDAKSTVASASDDGKSQPEDSLQSLHILGFTRCPREFRDALLEGELLKECQEGMQSVGLEAEMPTGSKIFCKPELYSNAMEALHSAFPDLQDTLRPYHVIVTEDLQPAVLKVVSGLSRGLKVKCKEDSVIGRISESQWVSVDCCLDRFSRKAPRTEESGGEAAPGPAEAPATAERQPTKTRKTKKAKGTAKAPSARQDLEIGPLFDDLLLPPFPMVPMMDPAMALTFMNPMFPAVVQEPSWSSSYLMRQALEEEQAMLTQAIACNLHVQQMMGQQCQLDQGIPLDKL